MMLYCLGPLGYTCSLALARTGVLAEGLCWLPQPDVSKGVSIVGGSTGRRSLANASADFLPYPSFYHVID